MCDQVAILGDLKTRGPRPESVGYIHPECSKEELRCPLCLQPNRGEFFLLEPLSVGPALEESGSVARAGRAPN